MFFIGTQCSFIVHQLCVITACQTPGVPNTTAVRIVCQAPRRQHHSVDLLKCLHWLYVRGRVDYKIAAVLCYKAAKLQQPSYLTCLLSPYGQSRVLGSSTCTSDLLSTQSSSTNITLLLVGSHAPSPPFGTVFLHLYALLIVSLVLVLSSRLTCSQDICSRSAVRASDLIPFIYVGFSRVINSLLTFLLIFILQLEDRGLEKTTTQDRDQDQTLHWMTKTGHPMTMPKPTPLESGLE